MIVAQPSYLQGFDEAGREDAAGHLEGLFRMAVLARARRICRSRFVDEDFAFEGGRAARHAELLPRWKRGVALTESSIGQDLGKLYVAKYFPPENKARMDALVKKS